MKKIKLFIFINMLCAFTLVNPSVATQFVEISEGSEHKVNISSYELNRIKIEGGKIEGFRAIEGDITAVPDTKKGELFLHLPRKFSKKVTNIFLTSASGATFKLMLVPKHIPAEQIFLIERNATDQLLKISGEYRDSIIEFYKNIFSGKSISGYNIIRNKKKYKKNDLKITRLVAYESKGKTGLYGEVFEVKNTSKEIKTLKPNEFYQEGVRAVKIDSHMLGKGQTTRMYIISIKG